MSRSTMNFYFINNISFCDGYKEKLIKGVIAAEKAAKLRPFDSMNSARYALEALLKGILTEKGESSAGELCTLIDVCAQNGYLSYRQKDLMHKVRKAGNGNIHCDDAEDITPHEATAENIALSVETLKNLFEVCRTYFGVRAYFDPERIPLGAYYIERYVPKSPGEVIYGNYNYFVRDIVGMRFFLQRYPELEGDKKSVLVERSEDSRAAITNSLGRRKYLQPLRVVETSDDCDHRIVVYDAWPGCKLLSEIQTGELKRRDILDICIDLTGAMMELKTVGKGLYHRHIIPGCVMVAPKGEDGGYVAALVNMQMSKIVAKQETVVGLVSEIQKNNAYMAPQLRMLPEELLMNTDWEKADVYSIAKILLYCVDRTLIKDGLDEDVIIEKLEAKGFSDELIDVVLEILDGDINSNPTAKELHEVLTNECDNQA